MNSALATDAGGPGVLFSDWGQWLRTELAPTPGRLGQALRITILCVATVVVCMAWQIPEAALAAFLIFFASKEDAGSSAIEGFALILVVILAIGLALVITAMTAGDPLVRLLTMAALVFGGVFLSRTTPSGPLANSLAMVFAMALTAPDLVGFPDLITHAFLWMIPTVLVPMGLLILLNLVAGRSPARLYRDTLRRRFTAASDLLQAPGRDQHQALLAILRNGDSDTASYKQMVRRLNLLSEGQLAYLEALERLSTRLLMALAALPTAALAGEPAWAEQRLELLGTLIRQLEGGGLPVPAPSGATSCPSMAPTAFTASSPPAALNASAAISPPPASTAAAGSSPPEAPTASAASSPPATLTAAAASPPSAKPTAGAASSPPVAQTASATLSPPAAMNASAALGEIDRVLDALAAVCQGDPKVIAACRGEAPPPPPTAFLVADAWTNPEYARFAFKTSLAVMLCYLFYIGLDWPGIHTCVITCFYVALSSVAETLHKLSLRLMGCLIGALLSYGVILYAFPHIQSIDGLILVIVPVTFASAWIYLGSERSSYLGLQVALCFYLATLHDFGPSFDLGIPTERLIGILVGNLALAGIFIALWPVSAEGSIRQHFRAALAKMGDLLGEPAEPAAVARLDDGVNTELTAAGAGLELLIFEPTQIRPQGERRAAAQRLMSLCEDLHLTAALLAQQRLAATVLPTPVATRVRQEDGLRAQAIQAFLDRRPTQLADPAGSGPAPQPGAEVVSATGEDSWLRGFLKERARLYRQFDDQFAVMSLEATHAR